MAKGNVGRTPFESLCQLDRKPFNILSSNGLIPLGLKGLLMPEFSGGQRATVCHRAGQKPRIALGCSDSDHDDCFSALAILRARL